MSPFAGIRRSEAPIEAIFPYVNTVGFLLNDAEEELPQAVFRRGRRGFCVRLGKR
jgi:hypothetical protein